VYVVSSFWPRYEKRLCESDLLAGKTEYQLAYLASAFDAVLEAKNAGANVSALIAKLNEAVSLAGTLIVALNQLYLSQFLICNAMSAQSEVYGILI